MLVAILSKAKIGTSTCLAPGATAVEEWDGEAKRGAMGGAPTR